MGFFEILNECERKPGKLWVNQRRKFSYKFMQKWLCNNYILL